MKKLYFSASDKENEASDEEKIPEEVGNGDGDVIEKDKSEKSEKDEAEENVDLNGNLDLVSHLLSALNESWDICEVIWLILVLIFVCSSDRIGQD